MHVFRTRNVHEVFPRLLAAVVETGADRQSRNGPVIVFPEPTTIVYERPDERVIFWEARDANPFFHFFESLWMLAGREDVEFPSYFVKRIREYSDDGEKFHGAYGHRWRVAFGKDQLDSIINALRVDQTDRRQVIQMWDAHLDLGRKGKDLPCNLTITVQVNVLGELDMVVFNRSNDAILGATGANVVHFSMLQEYLASSIGVALGKYWQVSSNFHFYKDAMWEQCKPIMLSDPDPLIRNPHKSPYRTLEVKPYPIFGYPNGGRVDPARNREEWDLECELLVNTYAKPKAVSCDHGYHHPFFRDVAIPMLEAFRAYKDREGLDRFVAPKEILWRVHAADWRKAGLEWLDRRYQNYLSRSATTEVTNG